MLSVWSVSLPGAEKASVSAAGAEEEVTESAPVSGGEEEELSGGTVAGEESSEVTGTAGGDLQPIGPKIVGGQPGEASFLCSIATPTKHICHGSLIHPQFIHTTAFCIT